MFDFNDAEASKPQGQLIPDNTVVVLVAKLRPGGHGPDGWLKGSKTSAALMLDFEFTIDGGPYDRRKIWSSMVVEGNTEGHEKAKGISRSTIRTMLESANSVKTNDASPDAQAKRTIKSYGDLDGLRFCAVIGIEKSTAGYEDKNKLKYAITPDDTKRYTLGTPSVGASTASSAPAPKAETTKPAWA